MAILCLVVGALCAAGLVGGLLGEWLVDLSAVVSLPDQSWAEEIELSLQSPRLERIIRFRSFCAELREEKAARRAALLQQFRTETRARIRARVENYQLRLAFQEAGLPITHL